MAEQLKVPLGEPRRLPLSPRSNSNSRLPSWIGPPSVTKQAARGKMKQNVRITYFSPGLQPPVYITTSLSEPQWQPIEMDMEQVDEGQSRFFKNFEVEEGEYQYKFRLGPGDWWVYDEDKPTVDDGFGNKNNTLLVEKQQESSPAAEESSAPSKHEEETLNPAEVDDNPEESPLLRHESLSPESSEQEQAPLFRHESTSIDNNHSTSDVDKPLEMASQERRISVEDGMAPEPGQQDLSALETFPTDRDGILASIRRASLTLPEDETSVDVASSSPSKAYSRSSSAASTKSLPSVKENADDLKQIAEGDGEETVAEQTDGSTDEISGKPAERPAALMTPPMTPKEEHAPETATEDKRQSSVEKIDLQMEKQEGAFASFLVICSEFGQWLIRLCGGKANATAIVCGLIATLAAGAWKMQSLPAFTQSEGVAA